MLSILLLLIIRQRPSVSTTPTTQRIKSKTAKNKNKTKSTYKPRAHHAPHWHPTTFPTITHGPCVCSGKVRKGIGDRFTHLVRGYDAQDDGPLLLQKGLDEVVHLFFSFRAPTTKRTRKKRVTSHEREENSNKKRTREKGRKRSATSSKRGLRHHQSKTAQSEPVPKRLRKHNDDPSKRGHEMRQNGTAASRTRLYHHTFFVHNFDFFS